MTTGKPNLLSLGSLVLLLISILAVVAATAQESSDDSKVGDAGDPDNIVFEGLQSFTDNQIRYALTVRSSYLIAAHPQADRREFLAVLQKKVLVGYQAAGFPDARIDVRFDSERGKTRVSVTEGQQFTAGQIHVVGSRHLPTSDLVRWFTTKSDKSETSSGLNTPGKASRPDDPMWEAGEPVNFTPAWQTEAVAQVEACLAEQGYFFPKSTVEIQTNPASSTAALVITIQDTGPSGVIDQIKVTGPSLHSAADLTQFLRLRKGQRLTAARLVEARRKLRDCGRFWRFTVMPEYVSEGDKVSSRNVNLLIDVREMENVPHLSKSLSPTQNALMRFCQWLERFPSGAEDLEIKLISTNAIPFNIRAVVSPKHGFLINSADLHGAAPISTGFEVTAKQLQFTAWASGVEMAKVNDGSATFIVTLLPKNDETSSNRFTLSLAVSLSSVADSELRKPPLKFDIQITRAGLLDLERQKDSSCRIEAGELLLSNGDYTLRADARSGRLIRIDGKEGAGSIQVRAGKGIWNQAASDFERRAAPLINIYKPGHGFTTFLGLAAAEALRWKLTTSMDSTMTPTERTRAASALRKLLDPELLVFASQYFSGEETNSFSIPPDALDLAMAQNMLNFLSGYIFAASKDLFPKHSWPRTVARESTFVLMNQARYTGVELERLCNSEETGPIGFLVIASLLDRAGHNGAKEIAVQGLTRLRAQDFVRDCNLVLRGDSGLARSFARLAATLRALPDEGLTALVKALPENEATLLRELATALRSQSDASLELTLSPAISKYWDQRLRTEVRAALLNLARPKSQPEDAK